jgi:DNA-binding NarL/FixJ family response regulator
LFRYTPIIGSDSLVVDDHAVVRRGVRSLLESHEGWTVCGEAATGRDAVEQSRHLRPDVVVMDLSLPELNGLDAIRQILKDAPGIEVLARCAATSVDVLDKP